MAFSDPIGSSVFKPGKLQEPQTSDQSQLLGSSWGAKPIGDKERYRFCINKLLSVGDHKYACRFQIEWLLYNNQAGCVNCETED